MEQHLAAGAVIQKHIAVVELAVRTIDFQRNIGPSLFVICLYFWGNPAVQFLAENTYARIFRNSAQQVQSLHTHIVVYDNDRLLRHPINLGEGYIRLQFLTPSASAAALGHKIMQA